MKTIRASEFETGDTTIAAHLEKAAHHYEKAARHFHEAAEKEGKNHDLAADHHILAGSAQAVHAREHATLAVKGIATEQG